MASTLARLLHSWVLDRKETRAWAMYDWANSAMFTVVITAVFPIFYRQVAASGLAPESRSRTFTAVTTAVLILAAVLSPLLGALADYARIKKRLFAVFLGIGVVGTAGLFWIEEGDWQLACILFALVNLGAVGSFVFYDALLPSVARPDELDRLSTTGYALGYLGGGVCLALCLLLIQKPEWFGLATSADASVDEASLPTRAAFLFVAVWWLVFSIPMLLHVREPEQMLEADERPGLNALKVALARLSETFRELRRHRQAFVFMLAFFAYNDGIGTIIRLATVLGDEKGIPRGTMIGAILLVQFVGIPFTLLFGKLAGRMGSKGAILVAIAAYVAIGWLGYRLSSPTEFLVMAGLVGMVQGGAQALSRSLFASMVPKHKSAEFFGLFATLEKFAGILGPLTFTLLPSRGLAILSLIAFFVIGALLLLSVDVRAGRAEALAADERRARA